MEFDKKKVKLYSTIGPRATFGLVMLDLIKNNNNIMILTADVSTSAGLDRFRNQYTNNYIDVGISEQNLINVASGLSTMKYNVFTTTFAPFQTMRCLEQIKINQGYMKKKIVMVGLASGLVLGALGYTHCCIEDIGVLRSIPNITIISPADSLELAKTLEASLSYDGPIYIRLTGGPNTSRVYENDYQFKIGEPIILNEGNDGVIFSTGSITSNALLAVKEMKEKHNINYSLINVHTLKPLDPKVILKHCNNKNYIVTIEEHSIIGGLNSAISEILSKFTKNNKSFLPIAIHDEYKNSGSYEYMLDKNGLSSKKLIDTIIKFHNS